MSQVENISVATRCTSAQLLGVTVTLVVLLLAIAVTPAWAGKKADRTIGSASAGTLGGHFNSPRDIAVNNTGAGPADPGDFYVADMNNHRVQRFAADGDFERAWGVDVIAEGAPTNFGVGFEICAVAAHCKAGLAGGGNGVDTGGNGQLRSPTELAIDEDTGDVYVFDRNRRVSRFDGDGNFERAFGRDVREPATAPESASEAEICVDDADLGPANPEEVCRQGSFGTGGGEFGFAAFGGPLAVSQPDGNPTTGRLFVGDRGNRRLQEFTLDGDFVRTWGLGVQSGNPQFEICSASCQAYGGFVSPLDPPKNGTFVGDSPDTVAVDDSGIVYAGTQAGLSASFRIYRFDSTEPSIAGLLVPNPLMVAASGGILAGSLVKGLEIDPEGDRLLALNAPVADRSGVIQEIDTSVEPPAEAERHLEGVRDQVNGIGVSAAAGEILVSTNDADVGHRVAILDDDGADPALMTLRDAEQVERKSAVLSAEVTPNGPAGLDTRYRFEYSRDGQNWKAVPDEPVGVGDGLVPVEVSQSLTGLESNTLYRYRMVTEKAMGASVAVSPERTFVTDGGPPEVFTRPVHAFTNDSAWLVGLLNPEGSITSYYFEYGTDTEYEGGRLPVPDGIATGGQQRPVLQLATGLQSDTTYHYRLVAESPFGRVEGADRTFTARPEPADFQPRAYEQVTPLDKRGLDVNVGNRALPVSDDGNAAVFYSQGSLTDQAWGGDNKQQPFVARRSETGWESRAVVVQSPAHPPNEIINVRGVAEDDLSEIVMDSSRALSDEPAPEGGIYRRHLESPATLLQPHTSSKVAIAAMSVDGSHLAGTSAETLTGVAETPSAPVVKAYDWIGDDVRLVSRMPGSDAPFATSSEIGGAGSELTALSADGEQIFFSTPASGNDVEIYRRDLGEETIPVSRSQRSTPDPQGPLAKRFVSATAQQGPGDPAKVFFLSSELLTNDANTGPARAGTELYRYSVNEDELVAVSAEGNDANGAQVQGVIGHSRDGDWVYYVALGQVLSGQGEAGEPNLYVWHDDGSTAGETRFIATLANADADSWSGPMGVRTSRVAVDGKTLLLQSNKSLTHYPTAGHRQVYIYEADASGGAGHLSCISCRHSGQPSQGSAAVPQTEIFYKQRLSNALTEDGATAFFESFDKLVAADVNGTKDVYEWNAGEVSLVSSGTDTEFGKEGVRFMGATPSGDSVFFTTRSKLVGQDTDGIDDVYAARIGGGIAAQSPPPPGEPCVGDGCKPDPGNPPSVPLPSSATFVGPGNPPAAVANCRRGTKLVRGKCVRNARCHKLRRRARWRCLLRHKAARCRKLKRPARQRCVARVRRTHAKAKCRKLRRHARQRCVAKVRRTHGNGRRNRK